MKVTRIFVGLFIFLMTAWSLSACNSEKDETPDSTPIVVWEYKNETAFDTVYPQGWTSEVIRTGIMVFAPEEVAYDLVPGPTMTVILEAPRGFSDAAEGLDHFLEFGPLREGYVITSEIAPTQLGQYDGIQVGVEREATEMFIAMKGVITAAETAKSNIYYFVATAPTEQWDQNWPLFLAIVQNVNFNE
jgi:hypothetical protein